MTKDEARKIVKHLGGLFPDQVTPEQTQYLGEQLLAFSYAAASKAVKEHRGKHEFINYPQLLEGCRSAERDNLVAATTSGREGSWADVYRRLTPSLAAAGDFEVAMRVHRGWWHKCPQTDAWKRKLECRCRSVLVSLGMEPGVAGQWAAFIFETADAFDLALRDLRGELPAAATADSTP